MKKSLIILLVLMMVCLAGCPALPVAENTPGTQPSQSETTQPTEKPTGPSETVPPTEPEAPSTEAPTTVPDDSEPAFLDGWQKIDEIWYFYNEGVPHTGWLELDNGKYWFAEDGAMCTGWVELDGQRMYFTENGPLGQGWLDEDGHRYYLEDGIPCTGWLELDGETYYFGSNAAMHTGWLEFEGNRYWFRENGTMAKGRVAISDSETRYFTSTGKEVILVNPWNYVPSDYEPTLVYHLDYWQVAQESLAPLEQMLADCKAAGNTAIVVSAYRSHEYQKGLHQRRIQRFLDQGYSQEDAEREAARRVAVPGTSEHELGLAVDIVDINYQNLNEKQETMPAQQWLMAHCWEYGFILRYPNEKSEATGIIYEPWHYRYVGTELALELRDSGLCLEEYLDNLTEG